MTAGTRQRLTGDHVATMDASMTLHSPGFVDIEGARIIDVGPLAGAPELPEGSVVAVSDGLLMPGLLNGHAHSSMTVLKSLLDSFRRSMASR